MKYILTRCYPCDIIGLTEEKVNAGQEWEDAGPGVTPCSSVAVILLTETEMASVTSLCHTPVVNQPQVDVDLVGAGSPSI